MKTANYGSEPTESNMVNKIYTLFTEFIYKYIYIYIYILKYIEIHKQVPGTYNILLIHSFSFLRSDHIIIYLYLFLVE